MTILTVIIYLEWLTSFVQGALLDKKKLGLDVIFENSQLNFKGFLNKQVKKNVNIIGFDYK